MFMLAFLHVYRVDESLQFATAADQKRENSLKYAVNSPYQVDVANKVVNTDDDGSVTAAEKPSINTGECEYSASVKINSSFIPDSLLLDVFRSEDADINVLNQSVSDKRMQMNNGNAYQISDGQYQLQHTSQQLAVDSGVLQQEQTSDLSAVTAVASSYLKHVANIQASFSEVPVGVVMVEERNLIIRHYSTAVSKHVIWQGQRVKNFKRFKKNSSFAVLPRCIIGGRDLVPYQSLTLQQKEWFQNGLETESQSQNTDKLSQELFNWEPLKRRKHELKN